MAAFLSVLVACGLYVGIPVYVKMAGARDALAAPLNELSSEEIRKAEQEILGARRRLRSAPGRLLRAIPILGANLDAVDAAAEDSLPVLAAASNLERRLRTLEDEGVIESGAVRLDAVDDLANPVARQTETLTALTESLRTHRTGALAPPLWDALDELLKRSEELRETAANLDRLLTFLDALFGGEEGRTYLIALVNNAELRGAGGVLTGLGTVSANDGRLELLDFADHTAFSERPYRTVPAPAEFVRRYAVYKANTTLTLNASFSPDVPDVAEVASGIYETVRGVKVDGVMMVDPRGLAALMPPGAEIRVPGTNVTLDRETLAEFVYSDAYRLFDNQNERRAALILVGNAAFEAVLSGGLEDRAGLVSAAEALAGGHLRFVSFDAAEQQALSEAGATGDLVPPRGDSVMVVAQNFGSRAPGAGNKLDYWVDRRVSHSCKLIGGGASCSTRVELENTVPEGLPRYVAGRPYGLLRSYVETYVPADARLLHVMVDGAPAEYRSAGQAGHESLAVFVELPPGGSTRISVAYELLEVDPEEGYSLVATPQPLARDARISLRIDAPDGWVTEGPGTDEDDTYEHSGAFTRTIRVRAAPDERTGLPALWARLAFWD